MLWKDKYILDILTRVDMSSCKPVDTLISTLKVTMMLDYLFPNPTRFHQIIGVIQYLTFTRPDICLVINKVCLFMHAPTFTHWAAVKHILCYLWGTLFFGLHITRSSSFTLHGFTNNDWVVVLMIVSLRVDILSFFSYIDFMEMEQKSAIARSSTEASIKPWLKALLRLSGFNIYCQICRLVLLLCLRFSTIIKIKL
jgi:hypothetical protein